MPTVDERVARCIDERMADLITKLSVNDDSVAASYADAQMVGLKDELKIRVCPALSTPNELGLRPDEADHSEPEGAAATLGSVTAGATTVARAVPVSEIDAREQFGLSYFSEG